MWRKLRKPGNQGWGKLPRDFNKDVIEGIVVIRKGENPKDALDRIHAKVKDLNDNILPEGVKIDTFYDRTNLMDYATDTVLHNLAEGIILVTVIVFSSWQIGEQP